MNKEMGVTTLLSWLKNLVDNIVHAFGQLTTVWAFLRPFSTKVFLFLPSIRVAAFGHKIEHTNIEKILATRSLQNYFSFPAWITWPSETSQNYIFPCSQSAIASNNSRKPFHNFRFPRIDTVQKVIYIYIGAFSVYKSASPKY